jgi:RNA polymerase sigma factor (sigma-70 family)
VIFSSLGRITVEMSANGRQEPFLARIDRHRGILFTVASSYCRTPQDREDLVQETIAQLWRSYPRFDERVAFSTWMYRIAVNVAISFYRGETRRRHAAASSESVLERVSAPEDPQNDDRLDLIRELIERLEASMHLNLLLLTQWNLRKTDTSLRRLKRGLTVELVVSTIAVGVLAYFGYRHVQEPRFLIPAVLLYLYALSYLVAVARQLAQVAGIDYDEPVVAIQKKLEELRLARVCTMLWTLLFAPLMWLPIFIVGMLVCFGVDVYEYANAAWLAGNVLFGLAVIPLAIFLARRYGPRLRGSTTMRRLADAIAGQTLSAALASLDSIRRFEES